jgi:hypothetical protein
MQDAHKKLNKNRFEVVNDKANRKGKNWALLCWVVLWKLNYQKSLDSSCKKPFVCHLKALVVPIAADFYPQLSRILYTQRLTA